MIKFDAIPAGAFFLQEIRVEYQPVLDSAQERMWGREIIKKSSMCGHNNSSCLDTLLSPVNKAVSSTPLKAPLIWSFCSPIRKSNTSYTGEDTLPCRDVLWQHGQFAALARQGLLRPQRQFG